MEIPTKYYPFLGTKWNSLLLGPYITIRAATRIREMVLSQLEAGEITIEEVRKDYCFLDRYSTTEE